MGGQRLANLTLKHSLAWPAALPSRMTQLYFDLGNWLGHFHTMMESQESIEMQIILRQLELALINCPFLDPNYAIESFCVSTTTFGQDTQRSKFEKCARRW